MEVICTNCKAKLNIQDEKIPPGKRVIVNCPKCKNKIVLNINGFKKETPVGELYLDRGQSRSGTDASHDFYGEDVLLEHYEEGVKLALVMQNDTQQPEVYSQAVQELGYKYFYTRKSGEAISMMQYYHFDLLILSNGLVSFKSVYLGILRPGE